MLNPEMFEDTAPIVSEAIKANSRNDPRRKNEFFASAEKVQESDGG